MKVVEPAGPGDRTKSASAGAPPKPERASFAAVLKGKKDTRTEAEIDSLAQSSEDASCTKGAGQQKKAGTPAPPDSAALFAQPRPPLDPANRASPADKPQAPAANPQIDGLVREISVAVEGKATQVDIHLKSQTLDGLHIRISGDQSGTVAIQFLAASPQLAEFLSANVDRLSASLAERDIAVSEISVAKGAGSAPEKAGSGARRERR
jgi:hypothetical protein